MNNEPTITLQCVSKNGRRDTTTLTHHTLPVAREVAKWVLQAGNGLYSEIDVCTGGGKSETIRSTGPAPTAPAPEVLLVEDNAGDALLIGQSLTECQISVHLHIARDGEQALRILKDQGFGTPRKPFASRSRSALSTIRNASLSRISGDSDQPERGKTEG
jgi:hypothetical protein